MAKLILNSALVVSLAAAPPIAQTAPARTALAAASQPAQAGPCPTPATQVKVKEKSELAQQGGARARGTAAQIAAGSALGPVGAAVVAMAGSHLGKKVAGAVKTRKKVDVAEARPECAQQAPAQQPAAQQATAQDQDARQQDPQAPAPQR